MRFMIIVKANADSEAGIFPEDNTLMAEMTGYHEELQKAGVLLDRHGLKPSAQGWRIHCGVDGRVCRNRDVFRPNAEHDHFANLQRRR